MVVGRCQDRRCGPRSAGDGRKETSKLPLKKKKEGENRKKKKLL